jgi:hypothetical protein
MKGKVLIGACTTGMLLSLGLLIGANPSRRTATQWEYGVFLQGQDGFQWDHEGQLVVGNTAVTFIGNMDLPRHSPTNARKDALQRAVLDYLGGQGWELVQVVHNDDMPTTYHEPGTYHYAYWFKRPR